MKEWFNNKILAHKKRYIIIGIVLLILIIFVAAALFSHGFFTNSSVNLILSGTAEIDSSDIRLRIYLQEKKNGAPVDSYAESVGSAVDAENYIFNPAKSHCTDGEEIIKVEKGVLTISYGKRGTCSAYFDVVTKDYDIVTKVYKEKDGEPGKYEYVDSGTVDTSQYKLSTELSDCTKNGTVTAEGKASFTGIGTCEIVYKKDTTQCFVAGTKVSAENGYVNIENIKVGDLVWSVSEETGERELKSVSNTIINETTEIYKIKVGNVTIEATPRHRFYVMDKGWVRAYDLEEGDYLVSGDNKERQEITEIVHKTNLNNTKVYNLEVEDNHNYLISSDEILVHNGSTTSGVEILPG